MNGPTTPYQSGQMLAHYRVVRHLGTGGMGEVYLAEDTRLDRPVALKLLPGEVSADPARRERFVAEAKAASAINHPNVCTIYEVGETADGQPFIAMEYLEGQPLEALAQQRRVDLREIVRLGAQVADALEAARQHQVVHRDIKPGNIVALAARSQGRSTKLQVKVLDFGVAKRLDQRSKTTTLTQEGAIIGTPNYLSPELALGREVDGRTDVFSLGVVLYELAAGRNPFAGVSLGETLNNILNIEPAPLRPWNPNVTAEFERIVLKCLEKDASKRYYTPAELRDDLTRLESDLYPSRGPQRAILAAAAVVVAICLVGLGAVWLARTKPPRPSPKIPASKSVAVLPFANMSADKGDEYLSDGMTEELLNALTRIKGLRVPARTSCFVFKGKTDDIRKIGEQLEVATVLEGSVRKAGNQLRITAQLVNVTDGFHLWSETYDRDMTNIFALQTEIAARVAEALKVQLLGEPPEPTGSIEAYDLYLRGRYLWNRRTAESIRQAIGCFDQAIAVDPNYALAYAGLADAYVVLPNYDLKPTALEAQAKARAAALKALELKPGLAEAVATLACCKSDYDWDWAGAEADFRRAIELNPSYPTARQWYAEMLTTLGRADEAVREARTALELDKFSPVINTVYARALIFSGRTDEGIAVLRDQIAVDPSLAPMRTHLGYAYVSQGRLAEAITQYEAASRLNGWPFGDLGYCYAKAGRIDDATKVLQKLLDLQAQGCELSADIALIYHGLGNDLQAFESLEKAAREHAPYLAYYVVGRFWDDARSDPRFRAVMKTLNLVK